MTELGLLTILLGTHNAQLHTLLELYAMTMNCMENAESPARKENCWPSQTWSVPAAQQFSNNEGGALLHPPDWHWLHVIPASTCPTAILIIKVSKESIVYILFIYIDLSFNRITSFLCVSIVYICISYHLLFGWIENLFKFVKTFFTLLELCLSVVKPFSAS